MDNRDNQKINYVHLPHPGQLLRIEPIDYPNPYDFRKMHRHDYFEIILVKKGKGNQLIDFAHYEMGPQDLFVIYPGQVHLMNRNTIDGLIIQFRKNLFEFIHPVKHYQIYGGQSHVSADASLFRHLYDMTERMQHLLLQEKELSAIGRHKAYGYLQIVLMSLIELQSPAVHNDKDYAVLAEYLSLVSSHIHQLRKVADYADLLHCSPEKLNTVSKKSLGKNALELIHEELLLEIRRLLLLNELSIKEIAYYLNFEEPANFNAFVKSKTGLTPKELQKSVLEIYN